MVEQTSRRISRGQTIGMINVWRRWSEGLFSQSDLDFLVSVARQTAIAIESARLYLETQRRAREMSALVEVGRDISSSLQARTVLESIATHAKDLLNGNLSALFLPEQDGQIFRAIAAVGEQAEELRNDIVTLGEVMHRLGDFRRIGWQRPEGLVIQEDEKNDKDRYEVRGMRDE